MTRRQLGLLAVIAAVLLAGTCVLVFGPARGARNDIAQVRTDLNASRRGIFGTLRVGRTTLDEATAQLKIAEQSLALQQQGLAIARDSQAVAHRAAGDTDTIRQQTTQALMTVRQVLASLGGVRGLTGKLDDVVAAVKVGVTLAESALAVARQTLTTGREALAVAVDTLHELRVSRSIQQQLLVVARQTLEQTKEINRKIPGAPVFGPPPSAASSPAGARP